MHLRVAGVGCTETQKVLYEPLDFTHLGYPGMSGLTILAIGLAMEDCPCVLPGPYYQTLHRLSKLSQKHLLSWRGQSPLLQFGTFHRRSLPLLATNPA